METSEAADNSMRRSTKFGLRLMERAFVEQVARHNSGQPDFLSDLDLVKECVDSFFNSLCDVVNRTGCQISSEAPLPTASPSVNVSLFVNQYAGNTYELRFNLTRDKSGRTVISTVYGKISDELSSIW